MRKKTNKKPVILMTGGGYIDVLSCGSSILFNVQDENSYEGSRFYGNCQLTDCSRMISWAFDCNTDGLQKLDTAIKYLQQMRKGIVEGVKQNAIKEKEDKKKEELKKAA